MKVFFVSIVVLMFTINVQAHPTSAIVYDLNSGRIIYQNNAYEKRLIASTTKIMTFIIAYEYGNYLLDYQVEVGEEVLKMYGTSIYVKMGEKLTLRDLLYGLMLRSGNDAAVVIANFIADSEESFVKLMNDKARSIGMYNTIFKNSHGLDEETKNYSTAYDMALLSEYASNNSFYNKVVSSKYYRAVSDQKTFTWTNRNKLLFMYEYATGAKTGYTPSAGKTFVSTATNGNLNLTIVTLHDNNPYINHRNFYEQYFKMYQNYLIVDANKFELDKNYYNGQIYIKRSFEYPLLESELNKISTKVYLLPKISRNTIGYLKVFLNDKEIFNEPIYKKNENKKNISWFQKLIKKYFKTS